MIQKRHKIQIGQPENITIILVGCGGTGSFAALNLARLAASNPQLNIKLVFVDFDQVEEKNIGRQYFCPADIGRPKARTLADRLNLAFGLKITPVVGPFQAEMLTRFSPEYAFRNHFMLLVGAVDNPAGRRGISKAAEYNMEDSVVASKPLWWLDAGNDKNTGQVLLGNNLNPQPLLSKFGECVGLPLPSVQEPGIVTPAPAPVVNHLSCADLVAEGVQARTINYMAAAWLDVFCERLLITHDLDMMSVTFNQQLGLLNPAPITAGVVVDQDVKVNYRPANEQQDAPQLGPCPDCGQPDLLPGRDEIAGQEHDIVFCQVCNWQMIREDYDGLDRVRIEMEAA